MLTEPQHFGITVSDGTQSEKFYTRVLRLPFLAKNVNRGKKYDEMYRLDGAENHVYWYQIGDGGTELFHLPTHPPDGGDNTRLDAPGWRYVAYDVRGFDDFVERLEAKGASVTTAESGGGRCARVADPDGANILFFDSGEPADIGGVCGIKEIGLVAADPTGYGDFFEIIGLPRVESEPSPDFIPALFGYTGDIETALFGHIRLLSLPGAALQGPPRMFPYKQQDERLDCYSDTGIKHIAYYVDDIGEFYRNAAGRGVFFLFPPRRISGGSRMCYFSDPEGHVIEVMEIPPHLRIVARAAGEIRRAQMDAFSRIGRRLPNFLRGA